MNQEDRFRQAHEPEQLEMFTEEPKESPWPFIGVLLFVIGCGVVLFMI